LIGPEHESPRPSTGEGFGDAVTFAFGDPRTERYGTARIGLIPGEPPQSSGLALLFAGGDLVATGTAGAEPIAGEPDWAQIEAGDVRAEIFTPLHSWNVAFDGDDGGFDLRFEALCEPIELGDDSAVARAAGLHGYEQLCRVTGEVRVGDERLAVECLGQRGHQWGAPDWSRIELARTLSAWLDEDCSVTFAAVRPAGAEGHDAEALGAFLVEDGAAQAVFQPRLSTIHDDHDRQRRAGLELWPTEAAEYPLRAAGEAICGTTLELGRLQLDAAFFRWRMDGRTGVGRYDVLRRR
jgi:hypothetical protein